MVHFSLKPSLHADISVADNAKKIVSWRNELEGNQGELIAG